MTSHATTTLRTSALSSTEDNCCEALLMEDPADEVRELDSPADW